MNRLLRDLGLILALAALWTVSGYLIGTALEIIGFDTYRWGIIVAALNVILGMVLFLGLTKDPRVDRAFFETGNSMRPFHPTVGCLWMMPLMLLIIGTSIGFPLDSIRARNVRCHIFLNSLRAPVWQSIGWEKSLYPNRSLGRR